MINYAFFFLFRKGKILDDMLSFDCGISNAHVIYFGILDMLHVEQVDGKKMGEKMVNIVTTFIE